MKTRSISKWAALSRRLLFAAAAIVLLASCEEPASSSHFSGSDPGSAESPPDSMLDKCNDTMDNNRDASADRYGLPAHCTIGVPEQVTALGSKVKFYAVGSYNKMNPDVYTVTVVTGGGSGTAEITVTSANGDTVGMGLDGVPVTVTDGDPIYVGVPDFRYHRVVLYFLNDAGQFNLVAGEKWRFNLKRVSTCLFPPDMACDSPASISENGCNNLADDDGDGAVDSLDPDCKWVCTTSPPWEPDCMEGQICYFPQCNDRIDNDGDGKIDSVGVNRDPHCLHDCDDSEKD